MDALLLAEPGLLNYGLVPSMLMELACLYERFGAFEGALELMGKVTEFFPDFGKYGEVLHRAAVVMAHLSTLPNAPLPELMDRYDVALFRVYMNTIYFFVPKIDFISMYFSIALCFIEASLLFFSNGYVY